MPIDPVVPRLEAETRRRRRFRMFSHSRVPVRMMVPNFFTLLGLCAGLTAIRMAIEGRWELALGLVVFAALLDGIDGRVARLLKASSRFGAELDSLADFVNFGVAPAVIIFTWGLASLRGLGWICVLIFALASALRLARFNAAIDEDKPKWQSNYFTGMPTPAAAIVVLLPVYLAELGIDARGAQWMLHAVLIYTLLIAFMMVSIIPTYSGKLLHERISREWVLPIFIFAVAVVANLLTFPYATLSIASIAYLAAIPLSWRRFRHLSERDAVKGVAPQAEQPAPNAANDASKGNAPETQANKSGSARIVDIRPGEQKR
jgi:CDP-diacylglycerol--serine O-phosphatidyltransferase